jgi:uncharacterized protein (DUF488 family)
MSGMSIIYTIGHSNGTVQDLVDLLKAHQIDLVIDVRSSPHSKYVPQFNRLKLEEELFFRQFDYVYMGDKLGGKPREPGANTMIPHPDYDKIAASRRFKSAIESLEHIACVRRVALLCAEADPMECHREKLIGRALRERGNEVKHILLDGSIAEQPQRSLW